MLVLSRRLNEKIVLPGIKTSVQIVAIRHGVVRLGIDAPPDVTVLREEVQDRQAEWSQPAAAPRQPQMDAKVRELEDNLRHAEEQLKRLNELVGNRITIALTGLDLIERQLQDGDTIDAATTVANVKDDMLLLKKRLTSVGATAAARSAKPRKALLVEDNRQERELLATFLRRGGFDVDTAGDGTDALNYLEARGRPDVVLLDMGMPRCDGATAVRQIRRNPALAGLKIFAVSGHTPDEFNLDKGPTGIDRWFHKPFDPSAFMRDLQQELNR